MVETLIYRLRKRAEIRRGNTQRKSVQEGKPDRISDILEEAADYIEMLEARKMAKITKGAAQYQTTPRYSEHCALCSMFEPPDDCSLVVGGIHSQGWCKYFDRAKRKEST